jgi:hypothetical protein
MATGSLLDQQLLANFHAMSRAPFQDELARLMQIPRSKKALRIWANKSPDRHAQAVAIMARLAGYHERLEVQHSGGLVALAMRLDSLSDAELLALKAQHEKEPTGMGVALSPDARPPKALGGAGLGQDTPPPVVVEGEDTR